MTQAVLRVGTKVVDSTHNGYLTAIMLAFTEADRNETTLDGNDWGLYYQTTAAVARDRLDVLGYSLDVAKRIYERELELIKRELKELELQYATDEEALLLLEVDGWWASKTSFEDWLREVGKYLVHGPDTEDGAAPHGPVIFGHFDYEQPRDILGFPGTDGLACFRGILEVCHPQTEINYDLSELVERGFILTDERLVEAARSSIGAALLPSRTVIVLTEGSTDAEVLRRSLALLYPHLVEYFSFLDFETFRVQGGAGSVVNFLKAFVAAGVANRIVALLDSDTAARAAVRAFASSPRRAAALSAINRLSEEDRQLLHLALVDELSHAMIARELKLSDPASSRKRLQRIRAKILSAVEEWSKAPPHGTVDRK